MPLPNLSRLALGGGPVGPVAAATGASPFPDGYAYPKTIEWPDGIPPPPGPIVPYSPDRPVDPKTGEKMEHEEIERRATEYKNMEAWYKANGTEPKPVMPNDYTTERVKRCKDVYKSVKPHALAMAHVKKVGQECTEHDKNTTTKAFNQKLARWEQGERLQQAVLAYTPHLKWTKSLTEEQKRKVIDWRKQINAAARQAAEAAKPIEQRIRDLEGDIANKKALGPEASEARKALEKRLKELKKEKRKASVKGWWSSVTADDGVQVDWSESESDSESV